MPSVVLIAPIHVRRMERHAHLFHPVFGGDANPKSLLKTVLDNRIWKLLGSEIDPHVGMLQPDHGKDFMPEAGHLIPLESRFAVHPELQPIEFRKNVQELIDRIMNQAGEIINDRLKSMIL